MTDHTEARGTHVVVLLGSTRADSYNRRIAEALVGHRPADEVAA